MNLSMRYYEVFVKSKQLSIKKKISLIYCKMCCLSLPRKNYVMILNHNVEEEEQTQLSNILLFDFVEFKHNSYTVITGSVYRLSTSVATDV